MLPTLTNTHQADLWFIISYWTAAVRIDRKVSEKRGLLSHPLFYYIYYISILYINMSLVSTKKRAVSLKLAQIWKQVFYGGPKLTKLKVFWNFWQTPRFEVRRNFKSLSLHFPAFYPVKITGNIPGASRASGAFTRTESQLLTNLHLSLNLCIHCKFQK